MRRPRGAFWQICVLASASACVALSPPALGSPEQGRSDLRTANGLLNRGLHELAAEEYESALDHLEDDARIAEARYGLAVCSFRLNELERALEQLDAIPEIPEFAFGADAQALRGHALFGLQRWGAAADAFEELAREHSGHGSAAQGLAIAVEARNREGDHRAAVRSGRRFDALYERSGEHADFSRRMRFFKADSLVRLGELLDAASEFERLAGRDDAIGLRATLRVAQCLHADGKLDEALPWYERAAQSGDDATVPSGLLGSAIALRTTGKPREAIEALTQLNSAYPDHQPRQAALEHGRALLDAGEPAAAVGYFDRAAEGPDTRFADRAAYWGGRALLLSDRASDAATRLRQAAREHSDSSLIAEMRYDLAVALERAGDDSAAADAFEAFALLHGDHPNAMDAVVSRASLALNLNDLKTARELAEDALDSELPDGLRANALFTLGESLYRLGDFDQAGKVFRTLSEAGSVDRSTTSRVRYRLGMSLAQSGDFESAEPLLRASTASPEDSERFAPALKAMGDGAFSAGRYGDASEALANFLNHVDALSPAAVDATMKLGVCAARLGEHRAAVNYFDRVVDLDPRGVHATQALFEEAQCRIELGEDSEAETVLESVLEREDSEKFEFFALRHLGAIAMRRGDPEAAARWLGRAEAMADSSGSTAAELAIERARALLAAGDPDTAAEALRPYAGRGGPVDAQAWYGIACSRAGDHTLALRAFRSIEMDAVGTDAAALVRYAWAVSLRDSGDVARAVERYENLLTDSSGERVRVFALHDLATMHIEAERFEEGARLLAEMMESQSVLPEQICRSAIYQLAWAQYNLQEHLQVLETIDRSELRCDLGEFDLPAAMVRGESFLALGRAREAGNEFALVASADSIEDQLEVALLRLGEARGQSQEWSESEAAFRQHRERFPESEVWFTAAFGIGWALENAGEQREAITYYQRVAQNRVGETAARAQFQIGECYFALEEHEEAIKELLKVDILHNEPEWSAAALYESGRCFEALNKRGEARAQYREVVDRFGESRWAGLATERLERIAGSASGGRGRDSR